MSSLLHLNATLLLGLELLFTVLRFWLFLILDLPKVLGRCYSSSYAILRTTGP
jgi:hypothetical protein